MSAKRRRGHRSLVVGRKRETWMRRQVQECRSIHWSLILGTMAMDEFRRPENQDAKVATISCRCPVHRSTNLCGTVVISRNDERAARDQAALATLVHARMYAVMISLRMMLIPRRHRRAEALR